MSKKTDRLDREIRELEKALAKAREELVNAELLGEPLTFDELEALPGGSIVRTQLTEYRKDALGEYHSPDSSVIVYDSVAMEGNEPLLVSMAEPMTVGSVVRVGENKHAVRLFTGDGDNFYMAWVVVKKRSIVDYYDWKDLLDLYPNVRPYIEKED